MNINKGTRIYGETPATAFLNASDIIFSAVGHTLGRDGLNTAVPTPNGFFSIINDGKTIMETLQDDNLTIKCALNTLKESAFATNIHAGDGTTSTAILQHILLRNVLNFNSIEYPNGIPHTLVLEARDFLLSKLPEFKKEIKSEEDLRKVIQVAVGGDKELTDVVTYAFTSLDMKSDKMPAIVKADTKGTESELIEGVTLNPVEISPVALRGNDLATDEEFNVVMITQTVSRMDREFTDLIKYIASSSKRTILLYNDIMPSVMEQLLFNIQEGSLSLLPVKLLQTPEVIETISPELSKLFNMKVIDNVNTYQTIKDMEEYFGLSTGYIINQDTLVLKSNNTEYASSVLPAKTSVIKVGFITYSQQEEDFRRVEDAVHSAFHALQSGYVIGAGYTLLSLSTMLNEVIDDMGVRQVFQDSLSFIFNSLNKEQGEVTQGYIDYCMDNVFDSYKVVEQVILNAFTVVAQITSTNQILSPVN